MAAPTRKDDFVQKILLSFSTTTKLVWAINQIIIHELDLDTESQKLATALRAAQTAMIDAIRDLGVDVKSFEDYEIKASSHKNQNN